MSIQTTLVLLRHGESEWNKENRFTGWHDIDLSEKGHQEAKLAGTILKKNNFIFDYAFTSVLKRAIHTLWHVLDQLNLSWIPVKKSWKLNERHYGGLQGLNKSEVMKQYGEKKVKEWRRSFLIKPPEININSQYYPKNDLKYTNLDYKEIPCAESLKDTMDRVVPYWKKIIFPKIKQRKKVIIVAHGNSLRSLIKFLDNLDNDEIAELNIPTGIPMLYQFNQELKPKKIII